MASNSSSSTRRKLNQTTLNFQRSNQGGAQPDVQAAPSISFSQTSKPALDSDQSASDSQSENTAKLVEEFGDLFSAPPNTVLVHACNCQGSWGAGIALAFKKRYPEAFKRYQALCRSSAPDHLFGTALLITPCEKKGTAHYIGCLFTSKAFGKHKDSREDILEATDAAMTSLLQQIVKVGKGKIEAIWMCKINSGLFDVPWEMTKDVIERLQEPLDGLPHEIKVISLPS